MNNLKIATLLCFFVCVSSTDFHIRYSGSSFGNTGAASGIVSLASFPSGQFNVGGDFSVVTSFTLTVSGTGAGDGTFSSSADSSNTFYFNSPIGLDFTKDLVGQSSGGRTWGTSDGSSGDFNLFFVNGPSGTFYFTLTSGGKQMLLTSFAPAAPPAAVCGNGIVETGEQCDSSSSCCSACSFATSATVCRPSTGTCDVAETCTGSSQSCPADQSSNSATCFCSRQGLADTAMGYYCNDNGGYYQCLSGPWAALSSQSACPAGTTCGCYPGMECSCGGSRSPCVFPSASGSAAQTC